MNSSSQLINSPPQLMNSPPQLMNSPAPQLMNSPPQLINSPPRLMNSPPQLMNSPAPQLTNSPPRLKRSCVASCFDAPPARDTSAPVAQDGDIRKTARDTADVGADFPAVAAQGLLEVRQLSKNDFSPRLNKVSKNDQVTSPLLRPLRAATDGNTATLDK
eukprot:1184484-Prorocentrum_minimum.AAC.2